MRRLAAGALALLALGACSDPDDSPFDVTGVVTRAGRESLTIQVRSIQRDDADWFTVGDGSQLHDNYARRLHADRKTVGAVLVGATEVEPRTVEVGTCVRLEGEIQDHYEGKYAFDRPVFYVARPVELGC